MRRAAGDPPQASGHIGWWTARGDPTDGERVTQQPRARLLGTVADPPVRAGTFAARPTLNLILLSLALATACAGPPDDDGAPGGEAPPGRAELPDGAERRSQPAEVRQRMGSTEIAVVYNRPSARGRALYGGIVPYDSIWNPGADEATRIELSRDVLVEGRPLPAGKYSLWAIPRPDEWTLVFSRAHDVYHVPYPEGEDALRVRVRPRAGPHVESLAFHFPVVAADSAELDLHWGRTVVPLRFRPAP